MIGIFILLAPGGFPGELNLAVAGRFCGVNYPVAKPGSFVVPPHNHTADVTRRCLLGRTSLEPPGSVTQLSSARPGGFETDNGAALSDVGLSTEGDPRGPAGGNKGTNVSQLTGISSTDFLPA